MFTEESASQDSEMENCSVYESIEVPDNYTGPRLSFPLLPHHATALVEAFRLKQVSSPGNLSHALPHVMSRQRADQCGRNGLSFRVFVSGTH